VEDLVNALRLLAPAVALALFFVIPASAGALCPVSRLDCLNENDAVGLETSAPADSVDCGTPGQPARGKFDLVAGKASVHALVSDGSGRREIRVTAADRYVVLDAPAGPVAFGVRLHIVGETFGGGGAGDVGGLIARLTRAGGVPSTGAWQTMAGLVPVDDHVVLNLDETVGAPFELEWLLEAIARHTGEGVAAATLEFTDLPKGARVASCQGYAMDAPVPARPASWGRLKSAYR
jgi:hypothetical protein